MNERKKNIFRLLPGIGALLLSACAGSSQQSLPPIKLSELMRPEVPEWMLKPPRRSGFLYGTGEAPVASDSGRAREKARDLAISEVLQQLKVKVSSVDTLKAERIVSSAVGGSFLREHLTQRVEARVEDRKVTAIKVESAVIGNRGRTYYVLVALDFSRAEQLLAREIANIDEDLQGYIVAPAGLNNLERVRHFAAAVVLFERRDELLQQLVDLTISTKPYLLSGSLQKFRESIDRHYADLKIGIEPEGSDAKQIQGKLRQAMREQGIGISDNTDEVDLKLAYATKHTYGQYKDLNSCFVATQAGIWEKKQDSQAGVSAGTQVLLMEFEVETKGVGGTREFACKKAFKELAEQLNNRLAGIILGDSGN